jgi:hypothetical protein
VSKLGGCALWLSSHWSRQVHGHLRSPRLHPTIPAREWHSLNGVWLQEPGCRAVAQLCAEAVRPVTSGAAARSYCTDVAAVEHVHVPQNLGNSWLAAAATPLFSQACGYGVAACLWTADRWRAMLPACQERQCMATRHDCELLTVLRMGDLPPVSVWASWTLPSSLSAASASSISGSNLIWGVGAVVYGWTAEWSARQAWQHRVGTWWPS